MTRKPTLCRHPRRDRARGLSDASGKHWEHEDRRYLRQWVAGRDLRHRLQQGGTDGRFNWPGSP